MIGFIVRNGTRVPEDKIYFDTGASQHMFMRRDAFITYNELQQKIPVTIGDGNNVQAVGTGDVRLEMKHNQTIRLVKVLHVPELTANLVSGSVIMKNMSLSMQCDQTGVKIKRKDNEKIVMEAIFDNKSLIVCGHLPIARANLAGSGRSNVARPTSIPAQIWHGRMGHQNETQLKDTSKQVKGMTMQGKMNDICEPCLLGKSMHANIPRQAPTRAQRPGQRIHIDPTGKMPIPTIGGKSYGLIITDDF